jgi:hypothetical protein
MGLFDNYKLTDEQQADIRNTFSFLQPVTPAKGSGISRVMPQIPVSERTLPEFGGPMALQAGLRAAEPDYVEQITGDVGDYTGGVTQGGINVIKTLGELISKATDQRLRAGKTRIVPGEPSSYEIEGVTFPPSDYEIDTIAAIPGGDINQQLSDIASSLGSFQAGKDTIDQIAPGQGVIEENGSTPDGSGGASGGGDTGGGAGAKGSVVSEATSDGSGESINPFEDILAKAMENVEEVRDGQSSGKTIEEYKQDFANATGVDVSGKVNKSEALMAMGLALMQNKAGKGFNVGKMLSAVGEAGEKAMPIMAEARKEARAAQVAAGKYALQEKASAAAAKKAEIASAQGVVNDLLSKQQDFFAKRVLAQENRAHEARMKNIDREVEYMKEERENLLKSGETKGFYNREPEYTGVKIRMGMTDNGNRTVYANPVNDGKDIALRYVAMQRAQNAMDKTDALLAEIQNSGMPAANILLGRIGEILVAGGADPEAIFKDRGISAESEIKTMLNVLILENKRFATQETGNGISNQDRNDLADSFGQIDVMKNPGVARRALAEIRTIFGRPIRQIDSELESFMNNQNMYRSQDEYKETINAINKTLADSPFRPKTSKGQDGKTRYALGDY